MSIDGAPPASRVGPDGTLKVSAASGEVPELKWVPPTRMGGDGDLHYDAVTFGEGTSAFEIKVGGIVIQTAKRKNAQCEVVEVTDMFDGCLK